MTKDFIIRKLTSRRLWVSIAGFVSLLLVALGRTESDATQITSLIMAGASILGYVIGEGLVDSARAGATGDTSYATSGYIEPVNDDEQGDDTTVD